MTQYRGASWFRSSSAAFAASVLCASPAHADALSLDAAVEIAASRAPQMAVQRAALESAESLAVSAGRLPDPELVLGVDNVPVEGQDAWSLDADFMTMRKVGVMQSFPNSRKRSSERERAAAAVAVVRQQTQTTYLEVARAAADAWIGVYAAEQALEKLRTLEPEVRLQGEAARAALASGRGGAVDALAAQGAISEQADRVLTARREVQKARAELARWIGDEAQQPLAPPPAFKELPHPRERLLASLHRHASLQEFDSRLALARSDVDVARAAKRPDWSVELAYGERGAAFDDMASVEFRVGLPIFSRSRQDPAISARRAELTQLEAERDAELRMHEAEILGELAAWDAARERLELYDRERLPLARQQAQAALAGFQAGRVELGQVLASQIAEVEAQRAYAELIAELGRAWTFLRYLEAEHPSP
jgi:cobalt-zinc-cadmium efflux system outer membrane protein